MSRQTLEHYLYEFDSGYRISYVNFSRASDLTDAQLILTLERGHERRTFVFTQPLFNDIERNLVSCRGLYIATLKSTPVSPHRVEVGDLEGNFAYFTARTVKNITPTA
jgi:hypothetical protein